MSYAPLAIMVSRQAKSTNAGRVAACIFALVVVSASTAVLTTSYAAYFAV